MMKFNELIPELTVTNLRESLDFYRTLGFRIEYQRPEDRFAFLSFRGSQLMIYEGGDKWKTGKLTRPFGRGINFCIAVPSVEPLIAILKSRKHPLFSGPEDHWYRKGAVLLGDHEILVQDPDGYLFRFSQDLGKKPA